MHERVRILFIATLVANDEEMDVYYRGGAGGAGLGPDGLLAPTTEVEFRSVRFGADFTAAPAGSPPADSFYDIFVLETAVLQAGLAAEEEGFDAVCLSSAGDSGLYALRSRLSIPVVGPGIVGYHVASLLGTRLSILCTTPVWRQFILKNLRLCRLEHKLASIRDIGKPWTRDGFYGPDAPTLTQALIDAGRRAVEEDAADVLMIGSTSMALAVPALQSSCGVPVIDPGPWALKTAETLARMRVSHSKRAFPGSAFVHDTLIRSFGSPTVERAGQ